MRASLSISECQDWLSIFSKTMIQLTDELNVLDAATGDGEHGSNLNNGARAILIYLETAQAHTLGEFFEDIGMTIVNHVGGASGALYGTLFLRLGEIMNDSPEAQLTDLSKAFAHARDGIVELGRVKPGDKTLLDALNPAVESLLGDATLRVSLPIATSNARLAADAGRLATAEMSARKGRGSYQGDRSIGHIDPGATSMAKLFESLNLAIQA